MIERIEILNNTQNPIKGCIIMLPGRGLDNNGMLKLGKAISLENTLVASFQPYEYAWYPQPNGANDQKKAVKSLASSAKLINNEVNKIQKAYDLQRSDIAVCGFSAGGVMALEVAARSVEPFAAAISLSGAILEPNVFKTCNKNIKKTKFLLQHNWDDLCFEWYERYLPMRKCLEDKGYSLDVLERYRGGHVFGYREAVLLGEYLAPMFGYKDWAHPFVNEDQDNAQIQRLNQRLNVSEEAFGLRDRILKRHDTEENTEEEE